MAYRPVRTPSTQQRPENFLDDLSNTGPAIRLCDEGRATGAHPNTVTGEVMTQYLVAIHTPTTTTRPSQRTKRWTAISTRSTTR